MSSTIHLTEENVASLMNKLMSLGKLCNLVQSADGTQFITHEQIKKELISLIQRKGKLSITNDLFTEIGITHEQLIKHLGIIKAEGQVPIHILAKKDIVISQKYVDENILKPMHLVLHSEGLVKLLSQAQQHNVTLEFLISQIESSQLFDENTSKIEHDCLINLEDEASQLQTLLDNLKQINHPTTINSLMESNEGVQSKQLITIIKEQSLGQIYQNKLFLPNEYLTQTKDDLSQQFITQGYLAHYELKKLYLPGNQLSEANIMDSLLIQNKEDLIVFSEYIMSRDQLNRIKVEFQAIKEYVDLSELEYLPNGFQDFEKLFEYTGQNFTILAETTFACKNEFMKKMLDGFQNLNQELALEKVVNGEKPQEATNFKLEKKESSGGGKKKGGKGGGKKGANKKNQSANNDEDEILAAKMLDGMIDMILSQDQIEAWLAKINPKFIDENDELSFILEPLSTFFLKPVNQQFNQVFIEVFERHSSKKDVKQTQDIGQVLERNIQKLQYVQKCLQNQIAKHYKGDIDALNKSIFEILCKYECSTVIAQLTMVQAYHNEIRFQELDFSKAKEKPEFTATGDLILQSSEHVDLILQKFAKDVKGIFVQLQLCAKEERFLDFMDHLLNNIKNLGAHVKLLDKKSEKALIAEIKTEAESAKDESLGSNLVFQAISQCNNCYFALPLKSAKSKDLDKCVQILAQYLASNDYIDADSEIKKVFQDVETIKCPGTDKDLKAKIDSKIHGKEETPAAKAPDAGQALSDSSWVIEDGPVENEEGKLSDPKEEEITTKITKEQYDAYFLGILKDIQIE